VRLGELSVARTGLGSSNEHARRAARGLLEKLGNPADAPAFAVYLYGRQIERERGIAKALPFYRTAIDRDPELADAALRLGMALAGPTQTREEGIAFLRQYLRLAANASGAAEAHRELARLGRLGR
jgi:hypothetical protein